MLKFAPHFKIKGEKMALPFVLGLIIGGGAVYVYNNREQLSKNKTIKAGIEKGEEALKSVSNSLKKGAKNIAKNIKGTAKSTTSAKATAKRTKTTRTRKTQSKKTQNPTLIPATTSTPNETII